jgi:ABC-type dipeptide/oligopeptide/nickel transport system permease subunit
MIATGQQYISVYPAFVLVPSVFLILAAICMNVVGDGLRARWGVR